MSRVLLVAILNGIKESISRHCPASSNIMCVKGIIADLLLAMNLHVDAVLTTTSNWSNSSIAGVLRTFALALDIQI